MVVIVGRLPFNRCSRQPKTATERIQVNIVQDVLCIIAESESHDHGYWELPIHDIAVGQ